MSRLIAFALLALASMLLRPAHAADAPQLWLHLGGVSAHTAAGMNGLNPGIGIEARWSDTWAAGAGVMRNSQRATSRYVLAFWTPAHVTTPAGALHLGAAAGVVDGYRLRDGAPLPLAAPLLEWRADRASVSALFVPRVRGVTDGATAALLLKLRF